MTELKPLEELCKLLKEVRLAAGGAGKKNGGDKTAPSVPPSAALSGAGSLSPAPGLKSKGGKGASKAAAGFKKERDKAVQGFKDAVDTLRNSQGKKRATQILDSAAAVASTTSSNLAAIAGRYKGLGAAVKAAKIAEATMRTFSAVNEAYAKAHNLPKPFGLVAAPIAAGVALAQGASTVAQVSAQKFEDGGPVDSNLKAELEGGEYVVPRSVVNELGGFEGVENTLNEDGSLSSGQEQVVAPVINVQIEGDADMQAVSAMRAQVRQDLMAFSMDVG